MTDNTSPVILVVEDNLVEAMNVKNALTKAGMQVLGIAKTENELYSFVEKQVPDLVLMDIGLGGVDSGIDIAKNITERFRVPVVFSTSYCDDTTISDALEISPYGYLVKPYGALSLTTTIQVALERKKIEKEIFKMEYWPLELAKIKPSTQKLKGHVTVISGGLGAIGYATAQKFLKDSINVDVESNPVINISEEKINQSKEKFKIDLKKTNILLGVGGSGPTKRVPAKIFLETMNLIQKDYELF